MPLVTSGHPTLSEGDRAQHPLPAKDTALGPIALDVAAAAERQGSIASKLWDRYVENPRPDVTSLPGYIPLASVPNGYEAFAHPLLNSHSPEKRSESRRNRHITVSDDHEFSTGGTQQREKRTVPTGSGGLGCPLLDLQAAHGAEVFHIICHQRRLLSYRVTSDKKIHVTDRRAQSLQLGADASVVKSCRVTPIQNGQAREIGLY
jgi:hypothetical protein